MFRRKIIDVTGTPLTPSNQGKRCLGNGEHPSYECCCDECDYYLKCFWQFDWRPEKHRLKKWVFRLLKIDYKRYYENHYNKYYLSKK